MRFAHGTLPRRVPSGSGEAAVNLSKEVACPAACRVSNRVSISELQRCTRAEGLWVLETMSSHAAWAHS
jgi:hypothetical protein